MDGMLDLGATDLRRSGIRNLIRAGVDPTVAKAISGHESDDVFERYNITSVKDLREAAAKTTENLKRRREEAAKIETISLDERRTVMADKVLNRKKHPRIYDQTEKFYEEYRKEQAKNISGSGAALVGLIRDTVKKLDAVIGELNDVRNVVGMSEILLLANAGAYDRALQSRGGKARAAKLSPAQRTEIAKKAVEARWGKDKRGK